MKKAFNQSMSWFLIIWFPFFLASPVYSQNDDSSDPLLFVDEEEDNKPLFHNDATSEKLNASDSTNDNLEQQNTINTPLNSEEGILLIEENIVENESNNDKKSNVQNAILEGIQLSSEPGETKDEKIITCYFIFRDKPTSYFFEAKQKEKEIIFEFNDVVVGSSPIPSTKEPPIRGFRFQAEKIDANIEVVGLNPEWHDILKVSFFFDAIPEITVKDEYSVISFAFKWSSNPEKAKEYTQRDGVNKPLLYSLIGGGIAIPAIVALVLIKKPKGGSDVLPALSIDDLPEHPPEN